jgi:hypothetical protein
MSTLYSLPGIYVATDSTFMGGMLAAHPMHAVGNAKALQAAVDAAQSNATGGIVLIPSVDANNNAGPYSIQSSGGTNIINIPSNTAQLLICGTGGGVTLLVSANGTLFNIVNNSGLTVQDLTIKYNRQGGTQVTGTAFSVGGGTCNLLRVSIADCQYAVVFNGTTQGYLSQCFIYYTSGYPANSLAAVQVVGGAKNTWIDQCLLRYSSSASVAGQVGIAIGESTSTRVTSCQVESFLLGINLGTGATSPVASGSVFTNVRCATMPTGLNLRVTAGAYDAKFVACHFQTAANQAKTYQAQCVVIDPSGQGNAAIDTLLFEDCSSRASEDYGLEIIGGQNIQVRGGSFSGANPNVATSAGIAITGPAQGIVLESVSCSGLADGGFFGPQVYGIYIIAGTSIKIVNANCSGNGNAHQNGVGVYINGASDICIDGLVAKSPALGSAQIQNYGLEIVTSNDITVSKSFLTGNLQCGLSMTNVSNATVSACDLYGNGSAGISLNGGSGGAQSSDVFLRDCNIVGYSPTTAIVFSGTLSTVEITDCAGYNDISFPVLSSPPASGLTFTVAAYGYFGPAVFYVWGGTGLSVSINSQPVSVGGGNFTISPGDSAAIFYSLVFPAPGFTMLGN